MCPCCNSRTLEEQRWGICPVCGWQDDPLQVERPSYAGGANVDSLETCRRRWDEHGKPILPLTVIHGNRGRGSFPDAQLLANAYPNVDNTKSRVRFQLVDAKGRSISVTIRDGSVDLLAVTEKMRFRY